MAKLSLDEVNNLPNEEFETIFSNVVELWPYAAQEVNLKRPFANVGELCAAFYQYLDGMTEEEKFAVLRSHPDLAGRVAAQGGLTAESAREQQSASLDQLTEHQRYIITEFNARYKKLFGFPFIICARENKVQSIITGIQIRLTNLREEEVRTGIEEVKKICKLRVLDIVVQN